jgi:hypothetical protein
VSDEPIQVIAAAHLGHSAPFEDANCDPTLQAHAKGGCQITTKMHATAVALERPNSECAEFIA